MCLEAYPLNSMRLYSSYLINVQIDPSYQMVKHIYKLVNMMLS